MKQVLRFNKVIKLIIIAGDLCILNTIFIVLYHIIDVQTLGETFANSLSRLLVLLNLVYITCNYSKGIILHERIVRPERDRKSTRLNSSHTDSSRMPSSA